MTVAGDRYRDDIESALAEDGRALTITKRTTGSYSATTGVAAMSTSSVSAWGIVTSYRANEIDGTRILRGDRQLIIQGKGLSAAPAVQDQVSDGIETFTLIDIEKLDVDGTPFAFICQGRRGA